jgi:hypothetical protein
VKTKFASHVILFYETLDFKNIIVLCYGRQQSLAFQNHVPIPQVWVIAQVVVNILGHAPAMC